MPDMTDELGNPIEIPISAGEDKKVARAGAGRGDYTGYNPTDNAEAQANAAEGKASAEEDKKTAAKEQTKVEVTSNAKPLSKARPNPLFEYADYTYALSLHIIPIEKLNKMATTPGFQYINDDKTVLVASAGRKNDTTFKRASEYHEDFYFDNLKMSTVVGLNSRSRNSNAIEVNFTLIEPMGVTFLNRLMKTVKEFKLESWFQVPYMLQIDFFGNDELGHLMTPIKNQTKYIPIRIISCKVKVTPRGAEYALQGVPFSHQAFTSTVASTPAFFEVTATSISDFFSSTGDAGEASNITKVSDASKEREEAEVKEATQYESNSKLKAAAEEGIRKRYQETRTALSQIPYTVGSYTAAMNSYQKQLQDNNHVKIAEEYAFKFHPLIESSKIVFPKKTEAKKTPMYSPATKEGVAAIRAQAGLPVAGVNNSKESFTINAGTNIIEVINQVMRASEFIRSQFKDTATEVPNTADGQSAADAAKKPITWYRIVPVVEIKAFDDKLERYAKKTTYCVEPYVYYNTKFRDAPKSNPDYYAKEYNYIFTGKNKDILNFDIDFDTMFYTAITADRSKVQTTKVQQQEEQNEKDNTGAKKKEVSVQQSVTHPVSGQADMGVPASSDSKAVLVNDFAKSALSSSRGDMINVNLKIVGDPELIKQDDIFYNPMNNPDQRTASAQSIDPKTSSVMYDVGEVFALVTFRTPLDFDPTTGMAVYDSIDQSVFSGVYKVITVDNEFSKGQFTQTLNMIRLFDQPGYDTIEGIERQQNARIESPTTPKEAQEQEQSNKDDPIDTSSSVDAAINKQEQDTTTQDEFGDYDGAVERQRLANAAEADPWGNLDNAIADAQKRMRDDLASAEETAGTATDLGLEF